MRAAASLAGGLTSAVAPAAVLEAGSARWTTRVNLPPGQALEPTKPRLPPHQAVFGGWPAEASTSPWTRTSLRTGILAMKAGMTADWDSWGVRRALTVLKVEDLLVTAVIRKEERGYSALQVGAGVPRPKQLNRAQEGTFRALDVAPRVHLAEFRVTEDAVLTPGTPLLAQHFSPGQFVKLSGVTQGKGFQGAMKRHGFKGQGASHGNSVSHRVLGSTGNRQDPGKVIKGKKMPGRMGGVRITMDGLRVYKVDVKHNLLYLEGAVPGKPGASRTTPPSRPSRPAHPPHPPTPPPGTYLRVADSLKKPCAVPPPFPTYSLTPADRELLALWGADAFLTPFEEIAAEAGGLLKESYKRAPAFELVAPPPAVDPFAINDNEEGEGV
jgi:large subunit ribosomal protein L3